MYRKHEGYTDPTGGMAVSSAQKDPGPMSGLALLKMCDEVWAFGPLSPVMETEVREAERLHIPVKYMEVDA